MTNGLMNVKLDIEKVEIEEVDEMVYLGQILSFEERIRKEVLEKFLGLLKNIYLI